MRSLRPLLLSSALALTTLAFTSTPAWACSTNTEQVRASEPYAAALPDCRAYEQVSPTDKNGIDVGVTPGQVQAAASGDAVTFYSSLPFSGVLGSEEASTYLATRSVEGETIWGTQGLLPPTEKEIGAEPEVKGVVEDSATGELSDAILSGSNDPPLSSEDSKRGDEDLFVKGTEPETGGYRLLAQGPKEIRFVQPVEYTFDGASSDGSRILFEATTHELVPGVIDPGFNEETEFTPFYLYEWNAGKLEFAGYVPSETKPGTEEVPAEGTYAGVFVNHQAENPQEPLLENVISETGSRVWFTDHGNGRVYLREPEAHRTIPVSPGSATWVAATRDGRYAFYIENGELFRFNAACAAGEVACATPNEVLTHPVSGVAGVDGLLGVAQTHGDSVYFTATAELPVARAVEGRHPEGEANIYEWHEDPTTGKSETIFIATAALANTKPSASRVTPDGQALVFASTTDLFGDDTAEDVEIYRYDAAGERLACVSCNPAGQATANAGLASERGPAEKFLPIGRSAFLPRNVSADGSRVFFETAEALVPEDTNNVEDVYEWEQEGAGTCPAAHGACVFLTSTGKSPDPAYFGDASADGSNVFFLTRQSLVGQDRDDNVDVYDAREEGGIAAQNPPSVGSGCSGEACRAGAEIPSVLAAPSSTSISSVGNIPPPPSVPGVVQKKTAAQLRVEQLTKALKACRTRPKAKRRRCEGQARKRYGSKTKVAKAGQTSQGGK